MLDIALKVLIIPHVINIYNMKLSQLPKMF